jgi:hypothetical protein
MTLGSTQPLTEMSTRNRPGGKVRPAIKTDNLDAVNRLICLEKARALTFHNPMDLHGLLQIALLFFLSANSSASLNYLIDRWLRYF